MSANYFGTYDFRNNSYYTITIKQYIRYLGIQVRCSKIAANIGNLLTVQYTMTLTVLSRAIVRNPLYVCLRSIVFSVQKQLVSIIIIRRSCQKFMGHVNQETFLERYTCKLSNWVQVKARGQRPSIFLLEHDFCTELQSCIYK